jgi:hypothetical protein
VEESQIRIFVDSILAASRAHEIHEQHAGPKEKKWRDEEDDAGCDMV